MLPAGHRERSSAVHRRTAFLSRISALGKRKETPRESGKRAMPARHLPSQRPFPSGIKLREKAVIPGIVEQILEAAVEARSRRKLNVYGLSKYRRRANVFGHVAKISSRLGRPRNFRKRSPDVNFRCNYKILYPVLRSVNKSSVQKGTSIPRNLNCFPVERSRKNRGLDKNIPNCFFFSFFFLRCQPRRQYTLSRFFYRTIRIAFYHTTINRSFRTWWDIGALTTNGFASFLIRSQLDPKLVGRIEREFTPLVIRVSAASCGKIYATLYECSVTCTARSGMPTAAARKSFQR